MSDKSKKSADKVRKTADKVRRQLIKVKNLPAGLYKLFKIVAVDIFVAIFSLLH